MSRTKSFVKGLASGYLAMAVNILYTMGSVPLALHYLPKEEFGLWALVLQISGYFALLDIGMTSSVSRCLIDFKDNKADQNYGSMVSTATAVFVVQGLIVAVCGFLLRPFVCHLVDMPPQYAGVFQTLLLFQFLQLSLQFCMKIFGAILYAHQQYSISNLSVSAQLGVMFAGLWLGFHWGLGLYSMVFGGILAFILCSVIQIIACFRLRLMPHRGAWGRPQMTLFRELFAYGKDIFLFALGSQLVSASQVILVSRLLGLEAAAIWSICTKVFTLAQQVVFRIYDFSASALSEMYVRGEWERLRNRFRDSVILTASMGVLVGVIVASANVPFLRLWTQNRISWDPINNWLMALMIVIFSITRCHSAMFGLEKKYGMGRFIPLIEGTIFILSCLISIPRWGFSGLIVSAIAANFLLSGLYGLYRSSLLFRFSFTEMATNWLTPPARLSAGMAVFALPTIYLIKPLSNMTQLVILGGIFLVVAPPSLWLLGLTVNLREDIQRILSKALPFLAVRKA